MMITCSRFAQVICLAAVVLGLSACAKPDAEQQPSQVLARVNKTEITQLQFNHAVQAMGVAAPSEAVRREVISKLIDREIAVQAALEAGMDRTPEVLLQIEEARRDVLARAYAERIAARATPATAEDIERFFRANPALFAQRRIYRLREANFAIDLPQFDDIRLRLSEDPTLSSISEWSRENSIPFNEQIVIRAAEQLPMEALPRFQRASTGETVIFETPRGLMVYEILDAQDAPVSLDGARAVIVDHLSRRAGRAEVEERIKNLRALASIVYADGFSPFAD